MDSAQISYDVLNLLKVIAKYCCGILSSCHARQWYILAIFEWALGNQKSGGRLRISYQLSGAILYSGRQSVDKRNHTVQSIQPRGGEPYLTDQTHQMIMLVTLFSRMDGERKARLIVWCAFKLVNW